MRDIYQSVTDKIIDQLEQGVVPWIKPWSGDPDPLPRNASSGRHYRGINNLILGIEASLNCYASNRWMTFRQALELGGFVRKGEKATQVVFFGTQVACDPECPVVSDSSKTRRIPFLKIFCVFNRSQIDGLEPESEALSFDAFEPCDRAEQIVEASGIPIRYQGFQACYLPLLDQIHLPERFYFKDAASFYPTAFHELSHATGHKSRLDRDLKGRFGSEPYAAEELIAELSSAFLAAHSRIDGQLQHANYIDSWIKVLKDDKKALFTAAAHAQRAADFLLQRAGLIETEQYPAKAA